MADCLEADHCDVTDNDRTIDNCSFQRDQFDIFKHDFRENAEKLGENSTPCTLDSNTKKEVANVVRSLQKAKYFVDSQSSNESLQDFSAKLESMAADLKAFLVGRGSLDGEFTASNVALPEYVHSDISLLMGGDDTGLPPEPGPLDGITALDRVTKAKIDSLLGAASILLLEYDDIKRILKSKATG
uniref:Spindle and kinetochore-associated protein 3 n=1 Tax=Steinernema glaseri TaxID=37863 RepID=A0A1I7ZUJ8_9BILA